MKIILTHDDGTVVDTWDSADVDNVGAFSGLLEGIPSIGPTPDVLRAVVDQMEAEDSRLTDDLLRVAGPGGED